MNEAADVARVKDAGERVLAEIGRAVVGKGDALELVLLAILAEGHVLIEDNPGLAKTLIARSFAAASGLRFARVQFTPDLMPSDVTGSSIYDASSGRFTFQTGPIFTNLLLCDEINRAPPKTQAALLEAMAERQVTSDDRTRPLEPPFIVIATQNPIEHEGTYPLPEAQLDRFMIRVSTGYPSTADEREILTRRTERSTDEMMIDAVISSAELLALQQAVETVHVEPSVSNYMVDLVAATRRHASVELGASPRASLALLKLSRARAALNGRDFVTPDDVKAVAIAALAHRIRLRPELWIQRVQNDQIVESCLREVPVPAAQASR